MGQYYTSIDALEAFIQQQQKSHVVVGYYPMPEYAGMALYIGFVFDTQASKFDLNLERMSVGLDLYGDTLQGSYLYRFNNLEALVQYIHSNFGIDVTDIPIKYQYPSNQFPDPLHNEAEKHVFEAAWERFKIDFRKGIFLDSSLKLIHTIMP
jgi:hypothetical protein